MRSTLLLLLNQALLAASTPFTTLKVPNVPDSVYISVGTCFQECREASSSLEPNPCYQECAAPLKVHGARVEDVSTTLDAVNTSDTALTTRNHTPIPWWCKAACATVLIPMCIACTIKWNNHPRSLDSGEDVGVKKSGDGEITVEDLRM